MRHLPLVAVSLAFAGVIWQGGVAYSDLRAEVKSLREWATVEVSHSSSWIDDLRARVLELESR